jgi:uncharacterized protein with WD repeat
MDSLAAKRARAERFKREFKAGPPPVPTKRLAHPGGKIVTTDKEQALKNLLARKQAAGLDLTQDQRRALAQLDASGAAYLGSSKISDYGDAQRAAIKTTVPPTAPVVAASSNKQLDPEGQKRIKTLRKKIKDIEILEERLAEGAVLQVNQKEKIASKAELLEALRQLMI